MGLVKLQAVAHSAESLLSRLRAGEIRFNPPIATALLRVVDAIREMLANIETSGEEGSGDYYGAHRRKWIACARQGARKQSIPSLDPRELATNRVSRQIELPSACRRSLASPEPPLQRTTASRLRRHDERRRTAGISRGHRRAAERVPTRNIRVDVGLLDKLMTLVGELVLARNQILQYSRFARGPRLSRRGAAAQSAHDRVAGQRDEDADAADRQRAEQVPAQSSATWRWPAARRSASRWTARRPSSTRR